MIYTNKALRDLLLANAGISTLVGGVRVYADRLPEEYDRVNMPQAIVIADPGEDHADHGALMDVTAVFECYGHGDAACDELKRAVHDYLDGLHMATVGSYLIAETKHVNTIGLVEDPDTPGLWEADVIFTLTMRRD